LWPSTTITGFPLLYSIFWIGTSILTVQILTAKDRQRSFHQVCYLQLEKFTKLT
jgi:purine-nucleoside phosphorylase